MFLCCSDNGSNPRFESHPTTSCPWESFYQTFLIIFNQTFVSARFSQNADQDNNDIFHSNLIDQLMDFFTQIEIKRERTRQPKRRIGNYRFFDRTTIKKFFDESTSISKWVLLCNYWTPLGIYNKLANRNWQNPTNVCLKKANSLTKARCKA